MRASGPHPPGRDADGRCQVSPAHRAVRASGPHPPGRDADGRCQVSPARRAMRASGPRPPGRDADGRCQVSPARRAMRASGPRTQVVGAYSDTLGNVCTTMILSVPTIFPRIQLHASSGFSA